MKFTVQTFNLKWLSQFLSRMSDILDTLPWLVHSPRTYTYDHKAKTRWLHYHLCRLCIMTVLIASGVLKLELRNPAGYSSRIFLLFRCLPFSCFGHFLDLSLFHNAYCLYCLSPTTIQAADQQKYSFLYKDFFHKPF